MPHRIRLAMRHPSLALPGLCLVMLIASLPAGDASVSPADLRVMSFNVRNGDADDGVNRWDQRRDLCAARIASAAPDLLGLQEALAHQNRFLAERLKDYTAVGVGRNDGKAKGEYTTILFRTARFTLVESGTMWLSPTPQVVGSKGWDAAFPRIATWARLRDRSAGDRELLWLNTHFDHKGKQAKLESARLLRRTAAERGQGVAVVITGDFNAEPGSAPHQALVQGAGDGLELVDAYAAAHPDSPKSPEGTSHGYRVPPKGPHIDWILSSPRFAVRSVEVDRYREDDRFPSDHFPVTAVLTWR